MLELSLSGFTLMETYQNDFSVRHKQHENMEGIDDRLIDIAELAISFSPIDFGVPSDGGFRMKPARQNCIRLANLNAMDELINHITNRARRSMCFVLHPKERQAGTFSTLQQSPQLCCKLPRN